LERQSTIKWLLDNQDESGGFSGRTGKDADACYCFWCGAALKVRFIACLGDAFALRFAILVDTGCWPPGQLSNTGELFVALSV
jgi:prenyltransferase beta subunit